MISTTLRTGILFLAAVPAFAQTAAWPAQWITVPGADPHAYGVYHFRRSFDLAALPKTFPIRVSADNRYQLFVNGQRVSTGPARGDLTHWRYETVDLAPHLVRGRNVLAAVVWNEGPNHAIAQVTNQTAFVLQSDSVNTGADWKCIEDHAYTPQPLPRDQQTGYYALGPNEKVDANLYPWGWEQPGFDDSRWLSAKSINPAEPRDVRDARTRWMLVPSTIPQEEQTLLPAPHSATPIPVTLISHSTTTILLDQSELTTAYPELTLSGGKGAAVGMKYAEALYISKSPIDKGNRNETAGKTFFGPSDTYISDGAQHRVWRPLFWRTFRYLELTVTTADEPVTIEDLHGVFTAYPFASKAHFEADIPAVQKILDTGWHTARLCAHESYMDCPYYEQLQYSGDARIQMLVSLYMTGDSRLMRNGIDLLNSSRTAEGATLSRAPSSQQQYIPPFSLWWIGMVHDYWMYVDDPDFVKQMLPGVHAVLSFYANYQTRNGSLKPMPWWNFVDWVQQWPNGVPPAEADGSRSSALELQLLLAYQWAANMESVLGSQALAAEYQTSADTLKATIILDNWVPERGLLADQPSHLTYSQQANTLAVLAHLLPLATARQLAEKILSDNTIARSSIYFRAYTNAMLREVGLGELYLDQLGPWRNQLTLGLTTWAEKDDASRSDCHAWGASPNFELIRTIAGIDSAAPGFSRVRIAPNLADLPKVDAGMPHPKGLIHVTITPHNAIIELPAGTPGEFIWHADVYPLKPGSNNLKLP